MPSGLAGRMSGAAFLSLVLIGATGCADRSGLPFIAEVPEGVRPAPESFPNINDNPERASDLRTPEEVEALERDLEGLRQSHVPTAETAGDSVRAG